MFPRRLPSRPGLSSSPKPRLPPDVQGGAGPYPRVMPGRLAITSRSLRAGKTKGRTSMHRSALITGASRGLGRTVAGFLAAQGYSLLLTARGEEDLTAAA